MRHERFKDKYIDKREIDKLRQELAAQRRDIEVRRVALDDDLRRLEAQEEILVRLRREEPHADAALSPNGKQPIRRAARTTPRPRREPSSPNQSRNGVVKKGDTTKMVYDAVRKHPGLDSAALATLLEDDLVSDARNGRKLIHSTLGYLREREKIRKDESGRYFAVDGATVTVGGA